jgi:hypothetical protein
MLMFEDNVNKGSSFHGDVNTMKVNLRDEGMDGRVILMDKMDHRK